MKSEDESTDFSPIMTQKHVVKTHTDNKFQSQPDQTIHHTNDETLEGLSCCEIEMLESVQAHMILVSKPRGQEQKLSPAPK